MWIISDGGDIKAVMSNVSDATQCRYAWLISFTAVAVLYTQQIGNDSATLSYNLSWNAKIVRYLICRNWSQSSSRWLNHKPSSNYQGSDTWVHTQKNLPGFFGYTRLKTQQNTHLKPNWIVLFNNMFRYFEVLKPISRTLLSIFRYSKVLVSHPKFVNSVAIFIKLTLFLYISINIINNKHTVIIFHYWVYLMWITFSTCHSL